MVWVLWLGRGVRAGARTWSGVGCEVGLRWARVGRGTGVRARRLKGARGGLYHH